VENDTLRDFDDWPACALALKEPVALGALPWFVIARFQLHGVARLEAMTLPIKNLVLLGDCPAAHVPNPPNFPTQILDAFGPVLSPSEAAYIANLGYYSWFDFDLEISTTTMPLRMTINQGDADSNTGLWGAIWHRTEMTRVANIHSIGDCETLIESVSMRVDVLCDQHLDWFPGEDDEANETEIVEDNIYFRAQHFDSNKKSERLLGLAVKIAMMARLPGLIPRYPYQWSGQLLAEYWQDAAKRAHERSLYEAALACLDRATKMQPEFVAAIVDKARIKHTHLGDIPGARADCQRALAIDPDNADAAALVRALDEAAS